MALSQFKRKPPADHLGGHTYDRTKTDHDHIQDSTTLVNITPPDLDEEFMNSTSYKIFNGIITIKAALEMIKDHHTRLFQSVVQDLTREARAEFTTLKSQHRQSQKREQEYQGQLEQNKKTITKTRNIHSMNWTPLQQIKFWTLLACSFLAMGFGVSNLSAAMRANNLIYLDAHWSVVLISSLVFVLPGIGLKERYDALTNKKEKERFLKTLFYTMLFSLGCYLLLFSYMNMPTDSEVNIFDETAGPPGHSQFIHFLTLLTQIMVEMSTAATLMIYAAKLYEDHVVVTDRQTIIQQSKPYTQMLSEFHEVERGRMLIERRLEILTQYFTDIDLKKQLYVEKAATHFQELLRRTQ